MSKTIIQNIIFKDTKAKDLYDLYMNEKKHSAVTNALAKITAKEGSRYSAYDNYSSGKNLRLIKNKLIVQTWRASDWRKEIGDSIFIIALEEKGNDTTLNVIHANLPDDQAESIDQGWYDYYWNPWKEHLSAKKKK